jgi:hypothetical protein
MAAAICRLEHVLPNLQQVAPIWETGHRKHPFSGPIMSRWIVPFDNTNTMLIEPRHISETEGVVTLADRGVKRRAANSPPTPMRTASGPRRTFMAQVSQRFTPAR